MNTGSSIPPTESQGGQQPLERPLEDRMVAGVAAGLARSFGLDVLVVRVALVVLAFVGGFGIPLYLAGWLLMPDEGSDTSLAESLLHRQRPV